MRALRAPTLVGIYLILGLASAPPALQAQDVEMLGRMHGVRPPAGYYAVRARDPNAYQFEHVWKGIARQVRARRRALAQGRDYTTLNSHFSQGRASRTAAQAAGTAVTGTFRFPVLVGYFADTTQSFLPDTADLRSLLFGTDQAPPYSVATYYDEGSNGLVTVTGEVIGWFLVDSASTYYEGSNNGLSPGTDATGAFIQELLEAADSAGVDFSVYDADGDDLIDLVAVLHPLEGGECGSSHLWSHRWVLGVWGNSFTADGVSAWDYMIQPAVGGPNACSPGLIMPIGTFAHELGHGMTDLPDLYDTGNPPNTAGIGVWGLMAAGNWNTPTSPAHLSAWSKDDVGWIAIDTVTAAAGTGARRLDPIVTSDTALRINVEGKTEYFLLENRHRLGADVNLRGEGLLIWHVDPDRIAARRGFNGVNASLPLGLALEQADGDDDLGNRANGGDDGDPWPGSSGTDDFSPSSTPNSTLNDGSASGVRVDSITVNGDQSIAFRVNLSTVEEVVTTSVEGGTQVVVDGGSFTAPYAAVWSYPSDHTIGVDSLQGDSLTRHVFQSWSDGGAREHTVSADAIPDTFIANLRTEHRLKATADPAEGSINSTVTLDPDGTAWLNPTDTARLVAVPAAGFVFVEWSGDTTWAGDTLDLFMTRPYSVNALFGLPVAIQAESLRNGVMGASYVDTLRATGGSGSFSWSVLGGDELPAGLTLEPASGVISGIPEEDGAFQLTVRAVSGALSSEETVSLTITQPTLALDDVVSQLLSPNRPLNADEQRFLDLLGNRNGRFDVGDFRAYLQESGVVAGLAPRGAVEADEAGEPAQGGAAKEEGR